MGAPCVVTVTTCGWHWVVVTVRRTMRFLTGRATTRRLTSTRFFTAACFFT